MILDRIFDRYYAPKKKSNTAAKVAGFILGGLAVAAFLPVCAERNKEKKSWKVASLLLCISSRAIKNEEGAEAREITVSIPGYTHIKPCFAKVASKCADIKNNVKKACSVNIDDIEEIDGLDEAEEAEVEVIIPEEDNADL